MILRKVELKAFGCFEGRTVEFRRGFNLVTGANESGKSTLLAAIPAVLFGVDDSDRYRPWDGGEMCAAALTLADGERMVRIERDFLTDQVTLQEFNPAGQVVERFSGRVPRHPETAEGRAGRERLARVLGLAPDTFPLAALCFGREDIDRSPESGRGQLVEIPDPVAANRNKPETSVELVSDLEKVRTRLARLQEELERDQHDYQQGKKYLAWARQQWERLSQTDVGGAAGPVSPEVAELQSRAAALRRDFGRTGLPDPLPPALPSLLAEAGEIRQDLVAVQGDEKALQQELHQLPKVPWGTTITLVIAVCAASGGFAWLRPEIMIPALAGGLLLGGLTLILTIRRAGKVRIRRVGLMERETRLLERREAAQSRLVGLDGRFEALGLSPSAVAVARMQKNLQSGRQLLASLREVEGALQGLGATAGPPSADSNRPANLLLQEDLPEAEAKLEALGASLEARERELQTLLLRERHLQNGLEGGAAEAGTRAAFAREVPDDGPQPEPPGNQGEATGRSPVIDPSAFSEDISQGLRQLTGGRYGEVKWDVAGHWLLREKGQRWRPLAHFSRGIAGSFRLAQQLGLARRLSAGGCLPVLLDEPLASFDRGHFGEALKLLERFGTEHQVILCSRDEQLLKRGTRDRWQLISLDNDGAAPTSSLPERNDDVGQLHLL